jgi:hypothetical protein
VTQLRDALQLAVSTGADRLRSIRNEARDYAQQYSWAPIADRYVDTYKWVTTPGATKPDWVTLAV